MICRNDADMVQLSWNNGKNTKTVPISKYNNCFTFQLVPGFKQFMAFFCAKVKHNKCLLACTTLIEDDKDEVPKVRQQSPWIPTVEKEKNPFSIYTPETNNNGRTQCHVIPHDDEEKEHDHEDDRALLLKYHHQIGHVSFQRLVELAKQNFIPKRLAKCHHPCVQHVHMRKQQENHGEIKIKLIMRKISIISQEKWFR